MVSAMVFGHQENLKIYILPNPVNERLSFPDTVERVKEISKALGNGVYTRVFIEEVNYQKSLVQQLEVQNVPAEGVKVAGQDKRARLTVATHLIPKGKVLFPNKGAERLIEQLVGFGIERHDDLADAFSILLTKIMEIDNLPEINIEVFKYLNRPYEFVPSRLKPISIDGVSELN
jgi:predicted phage terminase large subunit-like protein